MVDPRIVLVRLSSLGDIVHTLPAAAALRDSFPPARLDWIIDPRWARLLQGNPDLSDVVCLDRSGAAGIAATAQKLRKAKYTCAIDFQGLYKSALLAFASGAPQRIGFQFSYAREGLAALLYTDRLNPSGAHKVEHNLTLAAGAGAKIAAPRFPLTIRSEDDDAIERALAEAKLDEFFVLNPGGGWISKCWPAERYGALHLLLARRYGWRGVVSVGPGEEGLARKVVETSGDPPAISLTLPLGPLMALLRRAKFVVSADTGPLHLASALGAPVVGLYGPTDPSRNGPYSTEDVVVRNPRASETTYDRGSSYSPAMLSITEEQVLDAIERRLRLGA
jgi:heptosyltransferase I